MVGEEETSEGETINCALETGWIAGGCLYMEKTSESYNFPYPSGRRVGSERKQNSAIPIPSIILYSR